MTKYYTELHQLYRYYDEDGILLYAGITNNTGVRHRSHVKSKRWMQWVASSVYVKYESRQLAQEAEKQAIVDEKPLYNIVHNRVRGNSKRIRDYEKTKPKLKRRRAPKVKQPLKKERDPLEDVLFAIVILAFVSTLVCVWLFSSWFIKSFGVILFSFFCFGVLACGYSWCHKADLKGPFTNLKVQFSRKSSK